MLPGVAGGSAHTACRRRLKIAAFTCCDDVSNRVLESGGCCGQDVETHVEMLPPAGASGFQLPSDSSPTLFCRILTFNLHLSGGSEKGAHARVSQSEDR